jgi:hypothetical protein
MVHFSSTTRLKPEIYKVCCMLATFNVLLWLYFASDSNILVHTLWQFLLILDKINVHRHENLKH